MEAYGGARCAGDSDCQGSARREASTYAKSGSDCSCTVSEAVSVHGSECFRPVRVTNSEVHVIVADHAATLSMVIRPGAHAPVKDHGRLVACSNALGGSPPSDLGNVLSSSAGENLARHLFLCAEEK